MPKEPRPIDLSAYTPPADWVTPGPPGPQGPQGPPGPSGDALMAWPVGAVYWSRANVNPAGLIGGKWAVDVVPLTLSGGVKANFYAWRRTE